MANSRDLNEYLEWDDSQNSGLSNFKKNLKPIHLILLVLLVIVGIYLLRQNTINKNFVIGGIFVVIAIFLWKGQKKEKEPIPENIIKIITVRLMKRKIGIEYPYGTEIRTLPYCHMRKMGEYGQDYKPWKLEVGVRIIQPNRLKKDLRVTLHPFDGYIEKIEKMEAGYDGTESSDVKIVPTQFITMQPEQPKNTKPQ